MSALDHLPYGVFSTADRSPRAGVLVDDRVLDLADAAEAGLLDVDHVALHRAQPERVHGGRPTRLAGDARGAPRSASGRRRLHCPARGGPPAPSVRGRRLRRLLLLARARGEPRPALPARLRPADAELAPPADRLPRPRRHGRRQRHAVRRPNGQVKPPDAAAPAFGPPPASTSRLELGLVIGTPSELGEPVAADDALRARLRRRARQRLERARPPGVGVRAARPVPRQVLRDLHLPPG